MIILGVDPGLTRCGVGVIEAGANRRLSFIHVDVVRSDPHTSQDLRLLTIYNGLCSKMDRFIPDAVSIERVFAQSNRNTVLGTAQAAGMAMLAAAQRGIPVALHTPTEAKLAITGNGKAEKILWQKGSIDYPLMLTDEAGNSLKVNCGKSYVAVVSLDEYDNFPPMPPTRCRWRYAMPCARKAPCREANGNSI